MGDVVQPLLPLHWPDRERLGKLGGRWRDVLFVERRSAVVG